MCTQAIHEKKKKKKKKKKKLTTKCTGKDMSFTGFRDILQSEYKGPHITSPRNEDIEKLTHLFPGI